MMLVIESNDCFLANACFSSVTVCTVVFRKTLKREDTDADEDGDEDDDERSTKTNNKTVDEDKDEAQADDQDEHEHKEADASPDGCTTYPQEGDSTVPCAPQDNLGQPKSPQREHKKVK